MSLILGRKEGQMVLLGDDVTNMPISITVVSITGNQVKLAFDAPSDVIILREEVRDRELEEEEGCINYE